MVLEAGNLNDSHLAKVEVLARLCCLAQALGEHPFPRLFLLLGAHILLCSLLPSEPGQRWRFESPHVTLTLRSLTHPLMRSPVADLDNPEQSPPVLGPYLDPICRGPFAREGKIFTIPAMRTCTALGTVTLPTQSPSSGPVSCFPRAAAGRLLVPGLRGTGGSL